MGRRPIVQGRTIDVTLSTTSTTSTSPLVGQHANCTVTDQTTKIKGMFVRPEQIAEIGKPHPELGRLRLVVTRAGETDVMTLKAECTTLRGLAGSIGGIPACRHQARRLGRSKSQVVSLWNVKRKLGSFCKKNKFNL